MPPWPEGWSSHERTGVCDQHDGAEPHVRKSRGPHHSTGATLSRAVSIPDPSGGGVDVRADSDVVSLQHSGGPERAGMAGPANGQARDEVPAAGELLCVDRGLWTSPEAD